MVDYSQGEGNKRLRKRNKKPTKAQLARMAMEAEEQARQQGAIAGPSNAHRSDSEGSQGSGPENTIDDSMIDPVLTAQSVHRVGSQRSVRSTRSSTRLNSPYLSGARVHSTASASPEPSSGAGNYHSRLPSHGSPNQPAFGQSSFMQQPPARSSVIQPPTTTFGQTANIQAHATSSSRETRVPSSSGFGAGGFTQYQAQPPSFLPPSAQPTTRSSGSNMGSHRRDRSHDSSDAESS
jgi:hypothetical protein